MYLERLDFCPTAQKMAEIKKKKWKSGQTINFQLIYLFIYLFFFIIIIFFFFRKLFK